jgi:arabinofuranosyltransferase
MNDLQHNRTWRWTAIAVLPAVLLAAWQAAWPYPFFSDDSFISLRYSERLMTGHGLTWTDIDGVPERVEGYSNLLWVLLTAALGSLGIELVTAARLLGGLATLLALWFLAAALRPRDAKSAMVASVAPLLVASTQPVMIWTLAGLEGPLSMALLAWGFGGLLQRYNRGDLHGNTRALPLLLLGVPFAFACWTRPDGPLWALTAGTGLAMLSISSGWDKAVRQAFWFGLPALLFVVGQLAFRLNYYGDFVPNTAHVKAEFDAASIPAGYVFVKNAMTSLPGLAVAMLVGMLLMLLHRSTRRFTAVLVLPILAWLTYLVAIGGDHFPGLRLLHGVLVPMALLAAVGVQTIRSSNARIATTAWCALVVCHWAACYWNVHVARHDDRSKEARAEAWEWHDKVLGETLQRAFHKQQPRLAVDAAGALPYYSKLPALDMLGLCDRTIAKTPFPKWLDTVRPGTPKPPGHLRGNGDHVIRQQPDLMVFKSVLPVFVSGCEFEGDPRFLDHYRCVRVDLLRPDLLPANYRVPLWVRIDGLVGVQRTAQQIGIPAYLFGSFALPGKAINRWQPPTGDAAIDGEVMRNLGLAGQFWGQLTPAAQPSENGQLVLALAPQQTASLVVEIPTGNWRVAMEPKDGATLRVLAGGEITGDTLKVGGMDGTSHDVTLELVAPSDRAAQPIAIMLDRTP